jgi:predicted ATPase/HPt (histidine-containing phosphotransfer) domain-containing protein
MGVFDYDIKETLAVSSRSLVRRALRKTDGLPVIIKSPAQELATSEDFWQFEFEYRLLQKLNVPAVVRAIALERSADAIALVLEDFGGENPAPSEPGMAIDAFLQIAIQAARGLGQIHDANIVHKDVKPSNLLVNAATGQVKFIDFHLASELTSERQEPTAVSQIQGSFPYISPEQTGRMNRELDYRSDYYSLGVTLFELLTGQLPYRASDAMGFVHAHLSKRAPSASQLRPEVPAMISEIIAKLMAKDPDERYQSSLGIVSDLEQCQQRWRSAGSIATFSLGAHDVSERFAIPQKLFGREQETHELLQVFREVCAGQSRLLLISGPSGIGKTSLIQELQRPVTRANANFVTGKFDQLDRHVPYGAFIQALRRLVKQLLFESDARLGELRRSLGDALGQNAQIIVDLIPELFQILGPQPPVAAQGPTEAQHRFRRVFREFLKVFATAQHPLVVFVDDLQWLDASTPDLLTQLFGEGDLNHLLVIGTYRDNEVKDGHLLTLCLRALRERRPDAIREIRLEPLPESAVNELVAETLRGPKLDAAPLTRLLYERTEGNPFFVSELLSSLQRAGAFTFQRARGSFGYDLARVQQAAVTESVAELMVQRLETLSPACLRTLTTAACIGSQFDLGLLAELTESNVSEVSSALWEALVQRIVAPLDASYRLLNADGGSGSFEGAAAQFRFQHDRVHRAAYNLCEAPERARLHVAIGRRLTQRDQAEVDVFDIVNHLELGAGLLEPHEKRQLLELHLRAGEKAERSAAFAIAAQQFERALELANNCELEPAQRFEIHRQHVKCTFLCGEVERAYLLCERLFSLAPSPLAQAAVYVLKTQIVEHQGKLAEAVSTIRSGLRLFGVELPESPADIERGIGEGIGKMQAHLAKRPVEELASLPDLDDAERVMTLNLLFQVIPPAIQTYPPLFVLAELLMFDLALSHGVTEISCKNFVDCGIIQGGILGDYQIAYRLGQTAFKLLERYRPTPLESSVHFVFGAFVSHFRQPFREGCESLERAARAGLELGDIQHVAYATVHRSHRSLLVGTSLSDCEHEAREALEFLEGAHAVGQRLGMLVTTWSLSRLRGTPTVQPTGGQTEQETLQTLRDGGNAQWLYSFGQAQTFVSFVLGDLAAARRWQAFTEPFAPAGSCLFSQPDYHLFRALLLLHPSQGGRPGEREQVLAELEPDREKLERWAEACPANFAHKHWLLSAEIARAEAKPMGDVLSCYETALAAAGNDFIPFSALIYELQARYLVSAGQGQLSRLSLQRAYRLYEAWGAQAKLQRLAREFPELSSVLRASSPRLHRTESASTEGKVNLDLASVLKATRAISSEVRPERLFRTLLDTIIENAGAELGCLILKADADGSYEIPAWASVDPGLAAQLKPTSLDEAEYVCRDVVRYVMRTHESVVLDDAAGGGAFESDLYVQRRGVRSLLCIPVLNQGALLAVLYAENNAARFAFTKDRLEILSVIASQAAISIDNALLYQNLEQKVEERTRQLAEKNLEMGAMLDGMDQGIFTIDQKLNIQPQYSAHLERLLGTSRLNGKAFMPLLFRGARLRPDQLAATETALRFSFDVPSFLAEANLSHAVRSFEVAAPQGEARFLEVDWNLIVDGQGLVSKILVAVRDVTMIRRLEELARRREREADIVSQVLDSGLGRFRDFYRNAQQLLEQCQQLLALPRDLDGDDIRSLFRGVHTIKGNARLLGFSHVVDVVHQVEDVYSELRSGRGGRVQRDELVADIARIADTLREYEQVRERKLAPLAQTRDARLEQATGEIHALLQDAAACSRPHELLGQIKSSLDRLRAVPLAELVKDTSRMFPSLADELCKSVPLVECQDQGIVLEHRWAEVVREALVHAFRNALAHGIETADDRTARGKNPQGAVRMRAERNGDAVVVRLSDDGKGLAVDQLRAQTGRPQASDEELAEAIFASGISTAKVVSRVAGRGVGMDLIRSSVRKLGGEVDIVFTAERAEGYRPFELVLSLPSTARHPVSVAKDSPT